MADLARLSQMATRQDQIFIADAVAIKKIYNALFFQVTLTVTAEEVVE
jgi:hypothetical protein